MKALSCVTDTAKPTVMEFHTLFAIILRMVNYKQKTIIDNKRNEIWIRQNK